MPGETKRASLQKLFPPWTVTREQYAESLSPQCSGISNDVLLFSVVGLTLVHQYRVHNIWHTALALTLRLLLLTGTTTATSERPLSNASPQVTPMSGQTDDFTQGSGLRDVADDRKDGSRIRRRTSHLSSRSKTHGWRQEPWCLIVVRQYCRYR